MKGHDFCFITCNAHRSKQEHALHDLKDYTGLIYVFPKRFLLSFAVKKTKHNCEYLKCDIKKATLTLKLLCITLKAKAHVPAHTN